MTQTPMQELLQFIGSKELKPLADHIRSVYLEKEREFVGEIFKAGWKARNDRKSYTLESALVTYLSSHIKTT